MVNNELLGLYGAIVATISILWQIINAKVNGPQFVFTLAYIEQESRHLKLTYDEKNDKINAEPPDANYEKKSLSQFNNPNRKNFQHIINHFLHKTVEEPIIEVGFENESLEKYPINIFPGHLVIRFVRQNIGDRMGYLIIDEILFYTQGHYLENNNKKFPVNEWQMQPETQSAGSFHFKIPIGLELVKTGVLIINARFTNHKGEVKKIQFKVTVNRP